MSVRARLPWLATGLAFALVLGVGCAGRGTMINDVSTDLHDPPELHVNGQRVPFPEAARLALERAGAPQPWLAAAPIHEVQHALVAAITARKDWSLQQDSPGVLTFVATSRVFRFKDDVVVRLRTVPQGTRVDVRSRSRVGKGDFGVNRKRIEQLLAAAASMLGARP